MTTLATVLLLLLSSANAQDSAITAVEIDGIVINVGPTADNAKTVQWKVLAARNGIATPEALETRAKRNLTQADKLPYHYQRVEVAGVYSVDDSEDVLPGMFDEQIKTSHLDQVFPTGSFWKDNFNKLVTFATDVVEATSDTQGNPTARSAETIAKLKGQRINELVAHSWGSEMVYLGLLNGQIIPPKKLIIIGVPEANEERWLMLAKFTGIEIHVIGFDHDKLKTLGNAAITLKSGLPSGAKLEELWRKNCAARGGRGCADPAKFVRTKLDYNIGVQPPDLPKGEVKRLRKDHDRTLYYQYLQGRHLLNKTVTELGAPQAKLVADEENRMLGEAMVEAKSLIALAREQMKIAQRDYTPLANQLTMQPFASSDPAADARALAELKNSGPVIANSQPRPQMPAAAQPIPDSPFEKTLPSLKAFALAACRAPGSASPPSFNLDAAFYAALRGRGASDERSVQYYAMGMSGCAKSLYFQLIAMVLDGTYGQVGNPGWVANAVSVYSPAPSGTSGGTSGGAQTYYPPPSGGGGQSAMPPATPHHDPEGEALRQLKEAADDAAMRKRFGLAPKH